MLFLRRLKKLVLKQRLYETSRTVRVSYIVNIRLFTSLNIYRSGGNSRVLKHTCHLKRLTRISKSRFPPFSPRANIVQDNGWRLSLLFKVSKQIFLNLARTHTHTHTHTRTHAHTHTHTHTHTTKKGEKKGETWTSSPFQWRTPWGTNPIPQEPGSEPQRTGRGHS